MAEFDTIIANFVCRKLTNEELRKKYRDRRVGDIAQSKGDVLELVESQPKVRKNLDQ